MQKAVSQIEGPLLYALLKLNPWGNTCIHTYVRIYIHIYTCIVCAYAHDRRECIYICIHTYTHICIYTSCPIMCCVWCTENQEVEGAGYWLTLQRTQDMTSLNFRLLLDNREHCGIFSPCFSFCLSPKSVNSWPHSTPMISKTKHEPCYLWKLKAA